MGKVLRVVAVAASAVALVTPGLQQFGVIGLKAATTISTVAGVTAAVASVGSQLFAPKPIAKGSPVNFTIELEERVNDAAKWIADTGRRLSLERDGTLFMGGKAARGARSLQGFRGEGLALGAGP